MKKRIQTNLRMPAEIARAQRLVSAETGQSQQDLVTAALLFFWDKADDEVQKTREEVLAAVKRLKGVLPFEFALTPSAQAVNAQGIQN